MQAFLKTGRIDNKAPKAGASTSSGQKNPKLSQPWVEK